MFTANPFDIADQTKLFGFSVLTCLATFWFALFRNPEMVFLRLFQVVLYTGLPVLGAYGFLLQPIEQLIKKIPNCGPFCENITLSPMPVEAIIYWLALLVILIVLHFLNLWMLRRR